MTLRDPTDFPALGPWILNGVTTFLIVYGITEKVRLSLLSAGVSLFVWPLLERRR